MTDPYKIKPCPFCGGEPELIHGAPGCHFVKCKNCSASGDDAGEERAVAKWNRRVPVAPAGSVPATVMENLRQIASRANAALAQVEKADG